eukprot:4329881-Pleurochrysis_carterae.AAC.1
MRDCRNLSSGASARSQSAMASASSAPRHIGLDSSSESTMKHAPGTASSEATPRGAGCSLTTTCAWQGGRRRVGGGGAQTRDEPAPRCRDCARGIDPEETAESASSTRGARVKRSATRPIVRIRQKQDGSSVAGAGKQRERQKCVWARGSRANVKERLQKESERK